MRRSSRISAAASKSLVLKPGGKGPPGRHRSAIKTVYDARRGLPIFGINQCLYNYHFKGPAGTLPLNELDTELVLRECNAAAFNPESAATNVGSFPYLREGRKPKSSVETLRCIKQRFKSNSGYLKKGVSFIDYCSALDWAGLEAVDGPLSLREIATVVHEETEIALHQSTIKDRSDSFKKVKVHAPVQRRKARNSVSSRDLFHLKGGATAEESYELVKIKAEKRKKKEEKKAADGAAKKRQKLEENVKALALAATTIAELGGEAEAPWGTAMLEKLTTKQLKALIVRKGGKPKGSEPLLVAEVARIWAP